MGAGLGLGSGFGFELDEPHRQLQCRRVEPGREHAALAARRAAAPPLPARVAGPRRPVPAHLDPLVGRVLPAASLAKRMRLSEPGGLGWGEG